ncbi:MAG: alpha/beta hydrolase [Clostridia bacterium]|nr:alpha/beta hydrolase [Clostridia bacterium]
MALRDRLVKIYTSGREKGSNRGVHYDGVTVERNIRYGERKLQTFSLYRKSERVLPIIINFHGGGVAGRNKNIRRGFCVWLASNLDAAVLNVEYRGEANLGAKECLKEGEKLLAYLKESHKSLALDVDKVLFVGDGVGAYISSSLAAVAPSYDIRVLGVVGFSGLYDVIKHAKENQYYSTQYHFLKKFFKVDLKRAADRSVSTMLGNMSVTHLVDEDYPPCFIAYSIHDEFLPEQGEAMAKALMQNRVYCWQFRVVHENCYYNFHLDKKSRASNAVMEYLYSFIREALSGGVYRNEYREI